MPRLELSHSKEQLFLLDLSQKAECCRPSRFCVGFKNKYLHACAHTGNEEKAGYLNWGGGGGGGGGGEEECKL